MKIKIFLLFLIFLILVMGIFLLKNSIQISINLNKPGSTANNPSTKPVSPTVKATPTTKIQAKPTEPVFPTSANPKVKRYTSKSLGITFTYLTTQNNEEINVEESGKKVFVRPNSLASGGQYLEVFSKSKDEALSEAIKKHFLTGFSETNCLVKIQTNSKYPAGYQEAIISVPQTADEGMDTLSEKWSKCPDTYTTTNGISYFLENTAVPDKFLYLSIGQYGIESENNKLWQDTLEIF